MISSCILATVLGSVFFMQYGNGPVLADEKNDEYLKEECGVLEEAQEVSIDEEHFPDDVFRAYVSNRFDLNQNGILEVDEIDKVEELHLDKMKTKIEDLTGVEYLTYLESLNISNHLLTSLDLSQNAKLKKVICSKNQIKSLIVAPDALEYLDCGYNALKTLNVDQYRKLTELRCNRTGLKELDVSHNSLLKHLHVDNAFTNDTEKAYECNQLTQLDVSLNENLRYLNCNGNKIVDIDVCKNGLLLELYCDDNEISNIDLRTNTSLQILSCNNNKLTSLDLSKNTYLHYLHCENNSISNLDLTHNKNLFEVHCKDNSMTELLLGRNWRMVLLDCSGNQIKELDLSRAENLSALNIENNLISTLDLTSNMKLTEIFACNNYMEELMLPQNPDMYAISIRNNQLKSLDATIYPNLEILDCGQNPIGKLDVSNSIYLRVLRCDECGLQELDLRKNADLVEIACDKNMIRKLPLPEAIKIRKLSCGACGLSSIDLENPINLVYLDIHENTISKVDLSQCIYLESLYCDHNQIRNLNLENVKDLITLTCEKNPLDILNVLPCEKLAAFLLDPDTQKTEKDGVNYYTSPDYPGKFSVDKQVNLLGIDEREKKDFESFVERLYTVALNRQSDPEGKAFWVKQVVEEGKTGADCARFFLLDAPEFMKRNLSVEDFVETLYQTFFNRESDAAGKQGWVGAIRNGTKTRVEVVNDFIESTEWCNVCATYGVRSGALYHKATIPSENAMGFATRLYTCCLKRAPEENGLEYWSLALTNLEQTGAQAALLFFESSEFIGYNTSNIEYIVRLYTTFMGREPAASEIEYWSGEMTSGRQTRHSILAFFAQSLEFTAICKKYGIERGRIN